MSDAAFWGDQAAVLAREGRDAEAEAALRAGLAALPGHPILAHMLGCQLLARGAFAEGWALYEYRRLMPKGPRAPAMSFPEWGGEPVASLLVLPEQGLGDQILFARWLPALVARGVRVTLAAPPALARLFAPLGVEILPIEGPVRLPRADAWCFLGSLPWRRGVTVTEPYLPAGAGGGGIGLMLRGGPDAAELRDLPTDQARRLAALGRSLHPDQTGAGDFADTAAIIAGLDLVITVDTSVANLAGAMGKPAWVLLGPSPDWRWGREAERAALYPSVRLFRQPTRGDWAGVVDAVLAAAAAMRA
ncbi:MAG: hypothetical protein JF588_20325 [Caulobacterales bacterium]|nr:hypothetical protein [Caulobacterales bacterium]